MRRSQTDKSNQPRLRHRRARGQCQHGQQPQAHRRQRQAQTGGRGLAQGQAIQGPRQTPGCGQTQQPGCGHHSARGPADQCGAAQAKGFHGLQNLGVAQLQPIAHRAQHHPHHHPGQQQAQALLTALGQNQRQKHRTGSPHKRHPRHAQPRQPQQAQRGTTGQQQGQRSAQRRPGSTAQQVRIGQRVAKQSLRNRSSQAQQRPGQPSPQRARQANFHNDLLGNGIVRPAPHRLQPGATHRHPHHQQPKAEQQQSQPQPTGGGRGVTKRMAWHGAGPCRSNTGPAAAQPVPCAGRGAPKY